MSLPNLLTKLEQNPTEAVINKLTELAKAPENRAFMLSHMILETLRNVDHIRIFRLVTALSVESEWAKIISRDFGYLSECCDIVLDIITVQPDEFVIQPSPIDEFAELQEITSQGLNLLRGALNLLNSLTSADIASCKLLYRYKFIPRLLFFAFNNKQQDSLGQSCRVRALELCANILKDNDAAYDFCSDNRVFSWFLARMMDFEYPVEHAGFAKILGALSKSPYFPIEHDGRQILVEWVYGGLVKMLNKPLSEADLVCVCGFIETLANQSKLQPGIRSICKGIIRFRLDVLWRSLELLQQKGEDLASVLLLACNMLRYPGYNPPEYSVVVSVNTLNYLANSNERLFIAAARALKVLPFTPRNLQYIYAICGERFVKPAHTVPRLPMPEVLDDFKDIVRDDQAIRETWNKYCLENKIPHEQLKTQGPKNGQLDDVIEEVMEELVPGNRFFHQSLSKCIHCERFDGPFCQSADDLWDSLEGKGDLTLQFKLSLVQLFNDLVIGIPLHFVLNHALPYLATGISTASEEVQCALVLCCQTQTEISKAYSNVYLVISFLNAHEVLVDQLLDMLSGTPSTHAVVWDHSDRRFVKVATKQAVVGVKRVYWRLHTVLHLFNLLKGILQDAPRSSDMFFKRQSTLIIDQYFKLVRVLTELHRNPDPTGIFVGISDSDWSLMRRLFVDTIGSMQETTYILIRRFPSLFYKLVKLTENEEGWVSAMVALTGSFNDTFTSFAHISIIYMMLLKDKGGRIMQQFSFDVFMEAQAHSSNLMRKLSKLLESSKLRPGKYNQLSNFVEEIAIIKSVQYSVLCTVAVINSVSQLLLAVQPEFYQGYLEHLMPFLKFVESHYMNAPRKPTGIDFNFPLGLKRGDLKQIPGCKFHFVVGFEEEDESSLFVSFLTSLTTLFWHLSGVPTNLAMISRTQVFHKVFWLVEHVDNPTSITYMTVAGVLHMAVMFHSEDAKELIPNFVSLVVHTLFNMKAPMEACLLLFEVIRRVFPRLTSNRDIEMMQSLAAPLRTYLNFDKPMPKYLNFPMLKELKPYSTEPVPIDRERQYAEVEDEFQTDTMVPASILGYRLRDLFLEGELANRHKFTDNTLKPQWLRNKKVEEDNSLPPIRDDEAYPGQHVFQREVKSILQVLTRTKQSQILDKRRVLASKRPNLFGIKETKGIMQRIAEKRSKVEDPREMNQMKRLQKYATSDILRRVDDAYAEYLSDKFDKLQLNRNPSKAPYT